MSRSSLPRDRLRWLAGGWRLIALATALAGALVAVGMVDYTATRHEFMSLVRAQAGAFADAVAAAARVSRAASREAEEQLAERLLDNLRLLAELDRGGRLTADAIETLAARNHLFRVSLLEPDGSRTHQSAARRSGRNAAFHAGRGPGPGDGARRGPGAGLGLGPGAMEMVETLLSGRQIEVVSGVHSPRGAGGARIAAGVRRANGGAILISVDATEVAALQRQSSIEALLTDLVHDTPGVAYVVLEPLAAAPTASRVAETAEPGAERPLFGEPPDDLETLTRSPGALPASERQATAGGRPVLEIARVVGAGPTASRIRIGMRLDALRAAEERALLRLLLLLVSTVALGVVASGLVLLRRRFGTLTERHARMEEALRQRDRLAALGEMASTVAHEVRNPLNSIAMSAQRLEEELPGFDAAIDADTRSLVGVIRRESARINTVVQQFLDFARPRPLARRPTPLGPWLTSLVHAARPAAAARDIALTLSAPRATAAVIDPDQMQQALDNIMRNAIEATPAGGEVSVTARSHESGHVIEVHDTGAGIPPDVLPKIFDLYFTTKPGGTGVGLAVAHQIVSGHGGALHAESPPRGGTTVRISLPARTEDDSRA